MTKAELEKHAANHGATVEERVFFWMGLDIWTVEVTFEGIRFERDDGGRPGSRYLWRQAARDWVSFMHQNLTRSAGRGVNDAARVACKKSQHHGFHPANERCPYC